MWFLGFFSPFGSPLCTSLRCEMLLLRLPSRLGWGVWVVGPFSLCFWVVGALQRSLLYRCWFFFVLLRRFPLPWWLPPLGVVCPPWRRGGFAYSLVLFVGGVCLVRAVRSLFFRRGWCWGRVAPFLLFFTLFLPSSCFCVSCGGLAPSVVGWGGARLFGLSLFVLSLLLNFCLRVLGLSI